MTTTEQLHLVGVSDQEVEITDTLRPVDGIPEAWLFAKRGFIGINNSTQANLCPAGGIRIFSAKDAEYLGHLLVYWAKLAGAQS